MQRFTVQFKVMNRVRARNLLGGGVIVLLLVAAAFGAFTSRPVQAESGQALSISPPLVELKADPGQTVKATIKLTNISSGELLIKTQFNDFGAKNESGEPNIIFDDTGNSAFSLRQWIKSPEPFKIASKASKTLEFPIEVPKDAEPGGHYAVIRFSGTAPEVEDNGVSLSASIGTLVLLNVSGDVKENASLVDFYAATPNFEKSGFFENGPINFVQRIRNDGNVHVKPTGVVEIYDMFGKHVGSQRVNGDPSSNDNPPKSVLPQSIRRFDEKLDKGWMFGKYEARLTLQYGEGKTLMSTVTFWVIPYKLIALIIVGGGALGLGLFFGIKRYNKYIIDKAGKSRGGLRLK